MNQETIAYVRGAAIAVADSYSIQAANTVGTSATVLLTVSEAFRYFADSLEEGV